MGCCLVFKMFYQPFGPRQLLSLFLTSTLLKVALHWFVNRAVLKEPPNSYTVLRASKPDLIIWDTIKPGMIIFVGQWLAAKLWS